MKQRDAAEKNSRQPDAMPGALSQLLSIFDRGGRRTRRPRYAPQGEREIDQALLDILWFWKIEAAPAPEEIAEENLRMEHILRPTGVMRRRVELSGAWWKDASGPFLGRLLDGTPVALLPDFMGYSYRDPASGERIKIREKTAENLRADAYCFYQALPARPLKLLDLILFMKKSISLADILLVVLGAAAVSLLGMVLPLINKLIFDSIIPGGLKGDILPAAGLLLGATVASLLFSIIRSLCLTRLSDKLETAAQSAAMARIYSLPASFFKEYSAGDLAQRVGSISTIVRILSDAVLTTGLSTLFSFVYISQMAAYAPALVGPGLLIIGATLAFIIVSTLLQTRQMKKRIRISGKLNGMVFSLFGGISKIKLAGAERRAFAQWAGLYAQEGKISYNPPLFLKWNTAISGALTLGGTILLYFTAGTSRVSVSDYMAFSAAYSMVSAALLSLSGVVAQISDLKSLEENVRPIFAAQPEVSEGRKQAVALKGEVEISGVSFRYGENLPYVLKNFSLHVAPGEYVGIVGRSGCGKSTLMRLLIGFETPETGAVYYDGEDLKDFDLRSMRQKIGVDLQNGKLFSGDIFSNITITAPWSTMDDAWEAARLAGIAEDIEAMPMGMMTMVSEGSGGISGGQKQRILIARALVGKPQVLLFDEATSALDNIVQNQVAENIAALGCTRIAIAHRLSTVRQCDRIVMMDNGGIAEEGTYEQLMEKKGLFYDFAIRQI
ncbi:MAG: NHLP bacteriocin export ABC transporter permease/ATPase subunit [Clostridiales bacterium]|nr:NHLP bacteriocin export ABC transporter permease/ATPase subunit [Clostridiales bacterium]